MVKPGDTVKPDQSLITVESDKASMEIPSSHGGVVKEIKVKMGDKVAEGSLVLLLEAAGNAPAPEIPNTSEEKKAEAPVNSAQSAINKEANSVAPAPAPAPAPDPAAASFAGTVDLDCDLLVLGAGPGGYSAAFRAADLGLKVVRTTQ